MTDLTEQWKKGKLPEGWYWVDYYSVDGAVMLEYIPQHNGFGYEEKELVQAVLAEVPDYVEWRNMVNCACEEHEANKRLIEENAQLKEQINHLLKTQARQFVDNQKLQVKAEKAKDVVNIDTARQIKQLKELLGECLAHLTIGKYGTSVTPINILCDEVEKALR